MRRNRCAFLGSLVGALLLAGPSPGRAQERPAFDGSTPRRTLRQFVVHCREGDWDLAAHQLDLSRQPPELRTGPEAARLARRLKFVLDQHLWIDWEKVSDWVEGDAADGPGKDVVGELPLAEGDAVRLELAWVPAERSWLISAATVEKIGLLWAEHGAGWPGDRLPPVLYRHVLEVELWQWLALLVVVPAAWVGGGILARLLGAIGGRLARRTRAKWDDSLGQALGPPARYFIGLLLLPWLVLPLRLSLPGAATVERVRWAFLLVVGTWLVVRLVGFLAHAIELALTRGVEDEARVRGIRTQALILRRVISIVVLVVAGALVLLQFDEVRSVGMSLLASAGLAGIVLGLAAQRSISTLLAGIQLSFTQPIRIGDTVIVEGEWGWVEEITLTYVVVKVWDLRRLVVPIGRFLEQPFQNWTRGSTEILGTVEVFADWSCPLERVREELTRICKASPLWDGKVAGVQVTDVTPTTIKVRALVSSADAGKNWDLRCEVREKLIRFLSELDEGRHLPRTRVLAANGEDGGEEVLAAAAG